MVAAAELLDLFGRMPYCDEPAQRFCAPLGAVGAADETSECSRTSDGPTSVVDKNLIPHAYLGDRDPLVPVRRRMDAHKV